jgi:CBS domain containing-hemolysin-like protein
MSVGMGLFITVAMLLGNAFFVAAEFALVSARRSNIELAALAGSRTAKVTLRAMERVSLMLAGAQLGVTVCSLVLGAAGEPLIAYLLEAPLHSMGVSTAWAHPISFAIALSVMVYLHVVIGEMIPKNISLATSTKAALILVPPLHFFVKVTRPVVVTLNAIANATVRAMGIHPTDEIRSSFSRDEVAGFVKESHREGLLSHEEEYLLSNALDLEDHSVKRVVIPFSQLIITSARPTPAEIENLCATTGFSRFLVPGKKGTLKGYIHIKDVLQFADDTVHEPIAATHIRPLGMIRPVTSLRSALLSMQQAGSHVAQVVNAHGQVVGVAMLEDVLEELIGTIRDETRK